MDAFRPDGRMREYELRQAVEEGLVDVRLLVSAPDGLNHAVTLGRTGCVVSATFRNAVLMLRQLSIPRSVRPSDLSMVGSARNLESRTQCHSPQNHAVAASARIVLLSIMRVTGPDGG
jgi:hypothetical protein